MKTKIIISGPKVHDVGYRPFLISLADEFELDGIGVRNIEVEGKQAVRIKAEGEEECVQEFEEAVKTRRPNGAVVSAVESKPFDGRVPSIERMAITNMNTQLAKGINALESIDGKQDIMIGKQDEMISEIKAQREDLSLAAHIPQIQRDIAAIKERLGMP